MTSRQVNTSEVIAYADQLARAAGATLPDTALLLPGCPDWCGLPDDDARKLLALIAAGVRDAIANEGRQEALAQASQAISAAAQWGRIAADIHQGRGPYYIERRSA